MAQALESAWPLDAPLNGMVVTRYGHIPSRRTAAPQRIEVVEAAHPVPDAAGARAAQRMLACAEGLGAQDLVIFLISGGGSSLLSLPAQWPGGGINLLAKQRINQALLDSGASIAEMNCVRKHLSAIKGGQLAAACAPARQLTLLISDVPGDDPSTIASGPSVPDPSTCAEALSILQRYPQVLDGSEGDSIVRALRANLLETPKPGHPAFVRSTVQFLCTPRQALEAAARAARTAGLDAHILGDDIEGEAREVAKMHAAMARSVALYGQPFAKPCVLLSGGETTVTMRTPPAGRLRGRGGRAGEFCLGLAHALQGVAGVYALAADTDGIDGIEDNAGARVAPDTLARAQALGLGVQDHLDRNDSYGFFAALGDLVVTGPTYTNVNDFRALLVC